MTTTTPKLRSDLLFSAVEDAQGVLYVEVSDPKSGGVLRLFDFEWFLAQKFDGKRGFDEVCQNAGSELALAITVDDLKVYSERLGQLGLLEGVSAQPGKMPGVLMATAYLQAAGLVARVETTPAVEGKPEKPAEKPAAKPTAKPAEQVPEKLPEKTADKLAPKPLEKLPSLAKPPEVVAKPPAVAEPMKLAPPVKPTEPQIKPIEPVRRSPAREDDDRMGTPILPLRPPVRPTTDAAAKAPAEPVAKPVVPATVPAQASGAPRALARSSRFFTTADRCTRNGA